MFKDTLPLEICDIIEEYINHEVYKLANYENLNTQDCRILATIGYYPQLKEYLTANKRQDELLKLAALDGDLKEVRLLVDQGMKLSPEVFTYAVENQDSSTVFGILQYLFDINCPYHKTLAFSAAMYHDKPVLYKIISWMCSNKMYITKSAYHRAAERNDFDTIKLLYNNKITKDYSACATAARVGNLEMVEWLRARKFSWHSNTIIIAMSNEDADSAIKVIKWMLNNGFEPHVDFYIGAATNTEAGIKIMNWLYENKFPCDHTVFKQYFIYAIMSQFIDNIKWLLEHGILPDQRDITNFYRFAPPMIVNLIREYTC